MCFWRVPKEEKPNSSQISRCVGEIPRACRYFRMKSTISFCLSVSVVTISHLHIVATKTPNSRIFLGKNKNLPNIFLYGGPPTWRTT